MYTPQGSNCDRLSEILQGLQNKDINRSRRETTGRSQDSKGAKTHWQGQSTTEGYANVKIRQQGSGGNGQMRLMIKTGWERAKVVSVRYDMILEERTMKKSNTTWSKSAKSACLEEIFNMLRTKKQGDCEYIATLNACS